jgi:serine/threonine protein kinase
MTLAASHAPEWTEHWQLDRREETASILVLSPRGLEAVGLEAILAIRGFRIRVEIPCSSTVDRLRDAPPSLVLVFLEKGDEQPFEILDSITQGLASNAPPFVAIVDGDDESIIERALVAGMRDVIARPIARSLLNVKVNRFARRATAPALAIAGFAVQEVLGRGGMGTVYLARRRPGRGPGASPCDPVALKVLDASGQILAPESLARFKREVDALRTLRGPCMPRFYEAGRIEEIFYLAMEYLPGRTLAQLSVERRLHEVEVARVSRSVAAALEFIHRAGLVHRDVKPSNVIVTPEGDGRLVDYGLVKLAGDETLTRRDEVMGTVSYMAPELLRAEPASACSDAFALGMTMLEALIGRCPVEGRRLDIALARVRGEVPNPFAFLAGRVTPGMLALVDGLLAPDPARRLTIAQARERLARLVLA